MKKLIVVIAAALIFLAAPRSESSAAGQFFEVNVAGDGATGGCDLASCTLREAIAAANGNANPGDIDTITFNIPGAGPHVINVADFGMTVSQPVLIDGTTDGGTCAPRALTIELRGSTPAGNDTGIHLAAGSGGSTIRGMAFTDWANGVYVTSDNNIIDCSNFGIQADGITAHGNSYGVVTRGNGNVIGENPAPSNGDELPELSLLNRFNAFGGNLSTGVRVESNGNVVGANLFGFAPNGTTVRANGAYGIELYGNNNRVANNLISNSGFGGIFVCQSTNAVLIGLGLAGSGNTIQSNYIGTNLGGTSAAANQIGIVLNGANATIGGDARGLGNLISGNTVHGIQATETLTTQCSAPNLLNTTISNNLVGTNVDGLLAVANGNSGINFFGPIQDAMISDNVISGHKVFGLGIANTTTGGGHLITGNTIGLDITRQNFLPNARSLAVGGKNTIIDQNWIFSDAVNPNPGGVELELRGQGHRVLRNVIAITATGTGRTTGHIANLSVEGGTNDILIGEVGGGNTFGGPFGIDIKPGADNLRILNNTFGYDANVNPIPGSEVGIRTASSTNVLIGGSFPGEANMFFSDHPTAPNIAILDNGAPSSLVTLGMNRYHANGLPADILQGGTFDGLNPNDPNDGDAGPNDLLNYPDIPVAVLDDGIDVIHTSLTMDGPDGAGPYLFRLFQVEGCQPDGSFGPGAYEILSKVRFPDGQGDLTDGPFAFPSDLLMPGYDGVAAQVTDLTSGASSEIGECKKPGPPAGGGLALLPFLEKLFVNSTTQNTTELTLLVTPRILMSGNSPAPNAGALTALWNGEPRPTVAIGDDLAMSLSAADLDEAGTFWVSLIDADGNHSNALPFTVRETPAADIDGNGCIELADAVHMRRLAAGLPLNAVEKCEPGGMMSPDPDFDGEATGLDALYVLMVLAGLLPE